MVRKPHLALCFYIFIFLIFLGPHPKMLIRLSEPCNIVRNLEKLILLWNIKSLTSPRCTTDQKNS